MRAWLGSVGRRRIGTSDERIAWFVLVATIPAGVAGLLGEDLIADHLGEPWQIAILLAAGRSFSAGRTASRRRRRWATSGSPRGRDGLRTGARARPRRLALGDHDHRRTLHAARPDGAARFSFLLLLPTVLGAVLLKGVRDVLLGDLPDGWQGPFLVGTLAALGSGLLAIDWLLGYVRRHTYDVFVVYRLVIAALVLLAIVSGVRDATF